MSHTFGYWKYLTSRSLINCDCLFVCVFIQVIKERRELKQTGKSSGRRDLLDVAMDMHDDQTGLANG